MKHAAGSVSNIRYTEVSILYFSIYGGYFEESVGDLRWKICVVSMSCTAVCTCGSVLLIKKYDISFKVLLTAYTELRYKCLVDCPGGQY